MLDQKLPILLRRNDFPLDRNFARQTYYLQKLLCRLEKLYNILNDDC